MLILARYDTVEAGYLSVERHLIVYLMHLLLYPATCRCSHGVAIHLVGYMNSVVACRVCRRFTTYLITAPRVVCSCTTAGVEWVGRDCCRVSQSPLLYAVAGRLWIGCIVIQRACAYIHCCWAIRRVREKLSNLVECDWSVVFWSLRRWLQLRFDGATTVTTGRLHLRPK